MLHNDVKTAVDNRDVSTLKYIFCDCLDGDPTFNEYLEDYEYCKSHEVLFESHIDLHAMSLTSVDEEYWIQLKNDFMQNPSIIRMEHMREVAKILYRNRINKMQSASANPSVPPSVQTPPVPELVSEQIPVQTDAPAVHQVSQPDVPAYNPTNDVVHRVSEPLPPTNGIRRVSEPVRRSEPIAPHMEETPPKKANGVGNVIIAVIVIVIIAVILTKLLGQ